MKVWVSKFWRGLECGSNYTLSSSTRSKTIEFTNCLVDVSVLEIVPLSTEHFVISQTVWMTGALETLYKITIALLFYCKSKSLILNLIIHNHIADRENMHSNEIVTFLCRRIKHEASTTMNRSSQVQVKNRLCECLQSQIACNYFSYQSNLILSMG